MLKPVMLQGVVAYLMEHPNELARIVKNAAELKLGVPLAALRWLATRIPGRRAPTDVLIEAVPPGVRITATLELMGAEVRASGLLFVEDVQVDPETLRVEVRLADVSLNLLGDSPSPLGALISSGALDLSKLGNLVGAFPRRPPFILEAKDDRIVLDLKRHPALQGGRAELFLALVTPLVTVTGVRADTEHLDVEFGVLRDGFGGVMNTWRSLL